MTARTDRIDELLRQEIGAILAKDVQDPRIGFVTVTDVETAPDLSNAKVWVSVIGQPAERDQTIRALERAMPFVRHELGTRLRLRKIPQLHVHLDESVQRGTRVLQLLAELEAGGEPDLPPAMAESLPTPVGSAPVEPRKPRRRPFVRGARSDKTGKPPKGEKPARRERR